MTITLISVIVCVGGAFHRPIPTLTPTVTATATVEVQSGWVKYYSKGQMQRTARIRGLTLPAGYDGYSSTPPCENIGRTLYVRVGGRTFKTLTVDCSQTRDRARHIRSGLVAEVNFEIAQQAGFVSKGKAKCEVWFGR